MDVLRNFLIFVLEATFRPIMLSRSTEALQVVRRGFVLFSVRIAHKLLNSVMVLLSINWTSYVVIKRVSKFEAVDELSDVYEQCGQRIHAHC